MCEPMTLDPKQYAEVIDTLANSLQTALLLAGRLEVESRQTGRDAADLYAAVSRAAAAVSHLSPEATDGQR